MPRMVLCENVDFPTRVGMARWWGLSIHALFGFPHPRGDGPSLVLHVSPSGGISPPAWGWPVQPMLSSAGYLDFPTRVGMARLSRRLTTHAL